MEIAVIAKEIYESGKRLEKGSKELFNLAKEMADSEREYRKSLAIEIMRLKDIKTPVSIIGDIARGNTSELKFKRDMAELKWKAAINSLEAIKQQMSGLQTIFRHQTEVG